MGLVVSFGISNHFKNKKINVGIDNNGENGVINDKIEFDRKPDDTLGYTTNCSISVNLDQSYVFSSKKNPVIGVPWSLEEKEADTVNISLYKIKDDEEYIRYVTSEDPNLSKLEFIKDYQTKTIQPDEDNRAAYFEIPEHLEKGYYVIKYEVLQCKDVLQYFIVSDMSVYVGNVEREIIVWAVDNNSNKPIEGASVLFENQVNKTDKDGIVKITNLQNSDETYKKYLKVVNGNDEILVLVKNFNSENYYDSFVYSDKPIYKPSDTVYLWGYTPIDLYIDEIDYSKFRVVDGRNEYPVSLSDTGIFVINYKLNSNSTGDVKFYYKDSVIEEFSYEITSYKKPNIEYKIVTDRNNYMFGDMINVMLSANKLTGEAISSKNISVDFRGDSYSCVTGSNGKCNLSISLKNYRKDEQDFINELINVEEELITVMVDGDEVNATARVNIVYNNVLLEVKKNMQKDNLFYYDVVTKKISIVDDVITYTPVNQDVYVNVLESICERSKGPNYHVYSDTCDVKDIDRTIAESKIYNVKNGYMMIKDLKQMSSLRYTSNSAIATNYIFTFSVVDDNNHNRKVMIEVPYIDIDDYYLSENVSTWSTETFIPFADTDKDGIVSTYYKPIGVYKNLYFGRESYYEPNRYHIRGNLPLTMYRNSSTKVDSDLRMSYFFKEKISDVLFNTNDTVYKEEFFPGLILVELTMEMIRQ